MARKTKQGASRKAMPKQRQAIAWHKLKQPMLLIFSMLVVIGIIAYTHQSSTLPILHVTVEGEFIHVDKKELVKVVTPYATGSFLSVDVARLRKAAEALPWVKQVQVRRVWPDSLHLIVEEQIAVARWKQKWLVNTKGETFLAQQQDLPAGLALLDGPPNSHEVVVQRYRDMATKLHSHGLTISSLAMDERRAWKFNLNTGLEVVLGRANSEQRFTRFLRVYQHQFQQYERQISVMDMRYTNGLAVIWKTGQQPNFSGTV